MSIFCNIYLVDKINNWYCRKYKEMLQLTTPYWSMISSLLHLVGLRTRVYYTLTNCRGGGGGPMPPWPPHLNMPMRTLTISRKWYFSYGTSSCITYFKLSEHLILIK